jgi:ribosomal protein S8E
MGIGRDARHKHYKTGGRSKTSIKKRKYVAGLQNWGIHTDKNHWLKVENLISPRTCS